jgi:hypothetical protein
MRSEFEMAAGKGKRLPPMFAILPKAAQSKRRNKCSSDLNMFTGLECAETQERANGGSSYGSFWKLE